MKLMNTTISDGNSKLGRIPNVSLRPVKDCGNCKACAKSCYALKAYRAYPTARDAWDGNAAMARGERGNYFSAVSIYLQTKKPRFFRWHVSGDILDQNYLENMKHIAKEFPETKFLAFTKMHHLKFGRIPKNLTIVFSMWTGLKMPKNHKRFPKAWVDDGHETRIPESAIECPGRCEDCMACWALPSIGRDVFFKVR